MIPFLMSTNIRTIHQAILVFFQLYNPIIVRSNRLRACVYYAESNPTRSILANE